MSENAPIRVENIEPEHSFKVWSIMDGKYPKLSDLSEEEQKQLRKQVLDAAMSFKFYPLLGQGHDRYQAIELVRQSVVIVNPEAMLSEQEADISNRITEAVLVSPQYANIQELVPEFAKNKPPVFYALRDVIEIYNNEDDEKIVVSDEAKALAKNAIRFLRYQELNLVQ